MSRPPHQPGPLGSPSSDPPNTSPPPALPPLDLARSLNCIECGYNLKGLSIMARCPECGVPVKATLLARVDPLASELRPLRRRRLTAVAFVLWSAAALAACSLAWWIRIADASFEWFSAPLPARFAPELIVLAAGLSGIAAVTLTAFRRDIPVRSHLRVYIGTACYAPLLCLLWLVHGLHDRTHTAPYVGAPMLDPTRSALRLTAGACVAAALLGMRPIVVSLTNRSVVMRQGRIPTQSIPALAASVAIAAAGDLIAIARTLLEGLVRDVATVAAISLIGVGSFLITVGIACLTLDGLRLFRTLVTPAKGLAHLLDGSARSPINESPRP